MTQHNLAREVLTVLGLLLLMAVATSISFALGHDAVGTLLLGVLAMQVIVTAAETARRWWMNR